MPLMEEYEEWRPVVGWEGFYEVSSLGRVRSLDRRFQTSDGGVRFYRGRLMEGKLTDYGYPEVKLSRPGQRVNRRVHRLVSEAFIPNPAGHPFVLHWDDEKTNNVVDNLRWGTQKDNVADTIRNGLHPGLNATHCRNGHPYTPDNTGTCSKGKRSCRECLKNSHERARVRRKKMPRVDLPEGDPRHGTPAGYFSGRCRCDACREAGKSYRRRKNVPMD